MEEKYGFVVETTATGVDILASLGLQARDSDYNSLGYNRLGVYLCKHADVCLQHASVKHSASKVLRLVIVKVSSLRSRSRRSILNELFVFFWLLN